MDIWPIIATTAVVLTSIQILPQAIKSFKTKKVKDLSLTMIIVISLGSAIWLIYGIHLNNFPLIIANSLNFLFATMLLTLKLKHHKK